MLAIMSPVDGITKSRRPQVSGLGRAQPFVCNSYSELSTFLGGGTADTIGLGFRPSYRQLGSVGTIARSASSDLYRTDSPATPPQLNSVPVLQVASGHERYIKRIKVKLMMAGEYLIDLGERGCRSPSIPSLVMRIEWNAMS